MIQTYAPFTALGWLQAPNLTSMIAGPYFNRVLFYTLVTRAPAPAGSATDD